MAEASPLLRQLVVFNYSFVAGKPDQLRPDVMPFAIVARVSDLVRSQQQAVAAVVIDQAQRQMHLRLVDLIRG